MKRYIHTLYQSMEQSGSARISISYYSLTRTKSPRYWENVYFHLGNTVVSIGLSREESVHRTLRDILILLHGFPASLEIHLKSNPGQDSQIISAKSFLRALSRMPKKEISFHSLMVGALRAMESVLNIIPGGRISIPHFSPTPLILDGLSMNLLILLSQYAAQYRSYKKELNASTIRHQLL